MQQDLIIGRSSLKFVLRKNAVGNQLKVGPVMLGFITLILLAFFGMFYLSQANDSATYGYEMKDVEARLYELERQNKALELEAAELQSLKKIEEEIKQQQTMQETEKVTYLSIPEMDVAIKR